MDHEAKTVQKFTSFEELQAYEATQVTDENSLVKHEAFKKVMLELRASIERKKGKTNR